MDNQRFTKLVECQLNGCRITLTEKEKVYAGKGSDRLVQFKTAAVLLDCTPIEACAGMMAKHTQALYSAVSRREADQKKWVEWITDHINYLLLLAALVEEAYGNEDEF